MDSQAPAKNLKRSLAGIQSDVDDIKTSLTDHQYNELCKKLKTAHELVPVTTEYTVTIMSFRAQCFGPSSFRVDYTTTRHRVHLDPEEFKEVNRYLITWGKMELNIHGYTDIFRTRTTTFFCELAGNWRCDTTMVTGDLDDEIYLAFPNPMIIVIHVI